MLQQSSKRVASYDLPNLDFLRSVAVLLVLLNHLTRHYHIDRFDNLGIFGVLLFFVHTSLVLTYSMQRSHLNGTALIKDFYIRRAFRIYPLSILAVLAAVALHLHADGRGLSFGSRPGVGELISNLLLVQNLTGSASVIGPLWSLPYEIQMYIALPFLFLWRKRSVATLLVLWIIAGPLGHFPEAYHSLRWVSLLIYVPNFLPGVLAATLPERKTIPAYFWPFFVFSLAGLYYWRSSRLMGALLCLLLGCAIPRFREMSFRPLTWLAHRIATYSYGIYLGHAFFIWFALAQHNSWTLFWLMWVFVPALIYHAFEHPMVQLGRKVARWASRAESPPKILPKPERDFGAAEVAEKRVS